MKNYKNCENWIIISEKLGNKLEFEIFKMNKNILKCWINKKITAMLCYVMSELLHA